MMCVELLPIQLLIFRQIFYTFFLRRSSADSSVANSPARRGNNGNGGVGGGGGGMDLQREIFQYKQMRFNKEGGGGGAG